MADFTFNLGCVPPPVITIEPRPSVGSTREQGFVRSREIAERSVRRITYDADGVTFAEAEELQSLYDQTFGGIAAMDFTPPNGNAAFEVGFIGPISIIRKTANTYSIRFELEEIL